MLRKRSYSLDGSCLAQLQNRTKCGHRARMQNYGGYQTTGLHFDRESTDRQMQFYSEQYHILELQNWFMGQNLRPECNRIIGVD